MKIKGVAISQVQTLYNHGLTFTLVMFTKYNHGPTVILVMYNTTMDPQLYQQYLHNTIIKPHSHICNVYKIQSWTHTYINNA